MNISTFEKYTQKTYIPDSVYTMCGEETQECGNCSNKVYSSVVGGMVHDPLRGKVFCPFGVGESMNLPIFGDQGIVNAENVLNNQSWGKTTWGHVPQLAPRSLAKIGLSWRTS
jgi:hypothetical protein